MNRCRKGQPGLSHAVALPILARLVHGLIGIGNFFGFSRRAYWLNHSSEVQNTVPQSYERFGVGKLPEISL